GSDVKLRRGESGSSLQPKPAAPLRTAILLSHHATGDRGGFGVPGESDVCRKAINPAQSLATSGPSGRFGRVQVRPSPTARPLRHAHHGRLMTVLDAVGPSPGAPAVASIAEAPAPPVPPVPPAPPAVAAATFRFFGNEEPYWRLMIRGAVLLMVTLGIYRFWLATDQRRFLWANTEIAGDALEYAGTARELLIGFLIAVAVLVPLYAVLSLAALGSEVVGQISGLLALVLLALLG